MKKNITILILLFCAIFALGSSQFITDFLRLNPTTIPSSGTKGDIRYNISTDLINFFNGSIWGPIASSTTTDQVGDLINLGLSTSVAAGALTINLKQLDGSTDPASGSEVKIPFRDTTLATPTATIVEYDTATSIVIASGGTLGYADGDDAIVFVYGLYDGTNKEIAVSGAYLEETQLHNTTIIGSGSDLSNVLYSTNARTGAAIKLIGLLTIDAITTAGTWTAIDKGVINQAQERLVKGYFIDVNIGGGNPSLGTGSVDPYASIGNGTLDLVINSGSATVEITCGGGATVPEGLTCNSAGVDENLGIAFVIPTKGRYKVCTNINDSINLGAGGSLQVAYQLSETNLIGDTVLQIGQDRPALNHQIASTVSGWSHRICSNFTFTSTGKKSIKLFFEQLAAGTVNAHNILIDRAATVGQRDMHWTVEQL